MNLLEKLDALKAKTGDNNASLARNAGIPPTTIYGLYQKGYGNMKLSTLQAICDYFDVSLDFLAKDSYEDIRDALGSNSPASKQLKDIGQRLLPYPSTDANESELLDIYRSLNDRAKDLLINTARSLALNPDMKKES